MANRRMWVSKRPILTHISNEGVITDLTFGTLCYWDQQVGLGMSVSHRLTEQGPDQDGVTDLGFRLDQRTIGLNLIVSAHSEEALQIKQDRLYNLFKPRNVPYGLRITRPGKSGSVRQIDCHTVTGPVFSSTEEADGMKTSIWRVEMQVYAPDPVFYDPSPLNTSFGLAGGGGAWTIPWAVPWAIGSSLLDQTTNIPYGGQWEEFPIITINGPITDLIITNLVSSDLISFVGSIINTGEIYTIDLRPGRKSVIDDLGVNQIAKVASGSDMATFSLLPSPDAANGINPIRVQGSGVTTATQVYIQYFHRFIGGR